MTPERAALLKTHWARISDRAELAAELFYTRLFELDPPVRRLFDRTDLTAQRAKFVAGFGDLIAVLDDPSRFIPAAAELGRRHIDYGVKTGHYEPVGAALIWTLEQLLGPDLTDDGREAWMEGYMLLSTVMRRAAAKEGVRAVG